MSELIARLVEIFNAPDPAAVYDVMSPSFRDRDPLTVPGLVRPLLGGVGTRQDVVDQVGFLARPDVDVHFHLEKTQPRGALVDYQLYGEGLLAVTPGRAPLTALVEVGKLLGQSLHVTYSCIGTYRVAAGRLVERWGQAVLS